MNQTIKIGSRIIGVGHAPLVVAEMSGNHNQSLDQALKLVDAAADAGAEALKLQTYTADTLTIPGIARIEDKSSLWYGKTLHELYQEAHTPWDWHSPIFERAKKRGMMVFSTPFDETAVDFLEQLGVPCHKIASFENNDHPLLRKIASTGKPIIMSTGASELSALEESVAVLRKAGCKDLVLLKCTSSYPAEPTDSNIRTIPDLAEKFNCLAGLSDHTMGVGAAVAATALGAALVEKHFCLSRAAGGVDSAFSLEPHELKLLVEETARAFKSLGKISYGVSDSEKKSLIFKRSIYIVADIKAGEKLSRENMRIIRPGFGLQPKHFEELLGKTAAQDIPRGTPLSLNLLRDA